MRFKPGMRLRSQVDTTEVIVVRAPVDDLDLCCGGTSMVPIDSEVGEGGTPAPGLDTGSQIGKRYTMDDPEETLELLVTKQGGGTLTAKGIPLVQKETKALPSSD